ncbi:MAG TPA: Hsp20/alpha crystallin family protein [Polyangia bacterium]|nr:Hsp20/alpha crystallin family protein [Polyangia bacterium]
MLVRWTPFADVARLQQNLDTFFGTAPTQDKVVRGFAPAVDVNEDAEKIELNADLPGVKLEDIDIQLDKGVLTIKGERKLAAGRGERNTGAFSRAFTLPDTVDVEKIAAALKDGVLTLTLPKRPEEKPRQIKIAATQS